MAVYTYITPPQAGTQDNNSWTTKTLMTVKECSDTTPNGCDGLWNDNHCAQDEDYCQLYEPGDTLYIQFHFDRSIYKTIRPYIVCVDENGTETETLISTIIGLATIQTGSTNDTRRDQVQNLLINTSLLPCTCFYIKLKLYDCPEGEPCEDDPIAEHCTEPWRPVKCNEPTLLVSGTYPFRDCFGNYYATFLSGNPNSFIAQLRVPGTLQKVGFDFTEQKVGLDNARKDVTTRFLFRTQKLPPYVAEQLAAAWGAQVTYIDGVEYDGALKLEKAFDEGEMWIVNTTVTQICENPFFCE